MKRNTSLLKWITQNMKGKTVCTNKTKAASIFKCYSSLSKKSTWPSMVDNRYLPCSCLPWSAANKVFPTWWGILLFYRVTLFVHKGKIPHKKTTTTTATTWQMKSAEFHLWVCRLGKAWSDISLESQHTYCMRHMVNLLYEANIPYEVSDFII